MFWIWLGLLGVCLLTLAVAWYGSLQTTSIPFLAIPYLPEDFGWRYEALTFASKDGLKLSGWFIPAPAPSPKTIFILHGVGSNSGDMLLNTACLKAVGRWNLFYLDFRGHGNSEGTRTSLGPLELSDFETAMDFLKREKPAACESLSVFGHSLGGAVAIVGAARHPEIASVAAESPFSFISKTVRHFAWTYYGIPYFPFIPLSLFFTSLRLGMRIGDFAPAEAIGAIAPRPLYLIYAERDARMPKADFAVLAKAAGEPKEVWTVAGADHGEPWMVAKEEYEKRLVEFFQKTL